jgi:hypothetical protein
MTQQIYANPTTAKYSADEARYLIFRHNVFRDPNAGNLLTVNAVQFGRAGTAEKGAATPTKLQVGKRRLNR